MQVFSTEDAGIHKSGDLPYLDWFGSLGRGRMQPKGLIESKQAVSSERDMAGFIQ